MPAWMKRKMLSIEQQHIAVLVVAEILGHRQRRMAHAEPAARRLVHLAEDHHHVRQHAGFLHRIVKLLAFATAFADAAKNADALVMTDHVVDHFGQQHRLADARPAEKSRLAAALQRHEDIDDLDARLKDFRLGGTARQRRRSPMHRTPLDIGQCRFAVDGVAKHVEHPRENRFAHRRFQRSARVLHRHAASETLRGRQRNPAHVTRISLRQHFDDDLLFRSRAQHRVNRRQMLVEPDIHDAAAHRDDHAEELDLHRFLSEHIQPFGLDILWSAYADIMTFSACICAARPSVSWASSIWCKVRAADSDFKSSYPAAIPLSQCQ